MARSPLFPTHAAQVNPDCAPFKRRLKIMRKAKYCATAELGCVTFDLDAFQTIAHLPRAMFLHQSALKPVPTFARIEGDMLAAVEEMFGDDDELQQELDQAFAVFERKQPAVADFLAGQLAETEDELLQSLGYYLAIAIFIAFDETFPTRLNEVSMDALAFYDATLQADEDYRASLEDSSIDTDDVVAMTQPSLVEFLQHHITEAVDQAEGEVDMDELEIIYRAILVQIVALSHGVRSPEGTVDPNQPLLA